MDPITVGVLGAASLATTMANGFFSSSAADKANAVNLQINRENNLWNDYENTRAFNFNSQEAALNRAFNASESALAYQRSMDAYRSRYQDTVKDLRAANLNPLLAVSGMSAAGQPLAPAASGSAASGSALGAAGHLGVSPSNPWSGLGNIGASMTSALSAFSQLKNLDMAQEKTDAEVKNIEADTLNKAADAASKDPEITKEKRRYGENGLMGQVYNFVRSLADGMGYTKPFIQDDSNGASSSAKQADSTSQEFKKEVVPIVIEAIKKQSGIGTQKSMMSINDWDLLHGHGSR